MCLMGNIDQLCVSDIFLGASGNLFSTGRDIRFLTHWECLFFFLFSFPCLFFPACGESKRKALNNDECAL